MKLKAKFSKLILLTALGLIGTGAYSVSTNQAYATSTTGQTTSANQNQKYTQQVDQLKLAVDDMINVVNTNAYYNYASQATKAEYEKSIGNANVILARVPNASFTELRDATIRINNSKQAIEAEISNIVLKQRLEKKITESQTTVNAARQLMKVMPNASKKIKPRLDALIAKSEKLIAEAQAVLATL